MADFINNPFLAASSNVTDICFKIRSQLFLSSGLQTRPRELYFVGPGEIHRVFESIDENHDGRLNKIEFEAALEKIGIYLPLYEITFLMRKFSDGQYPLSINYQDFLNIIQFPLNNRRLGVVLKAYNAVNPKGEEHVLLQKILDLLSSTASRHPEVRSGKICSDQVVQDFKMFFDDRKESEITREGFCSYFRALGMVEPVDNLFVSIVEKLFNVQEENEINEFVKHLALELGEKIRERTMDNETEQELLLRAFKYCHKTGQSRKMCTREQLAKVFEHFGLTEFSSAIFDIFWTDTKKKYDLANLENEGVCSIQAIIDNLVPIWERSLRFGGRCDCGRSPDFLLDEPYSADGE